MWGKRDIPGKYKDLVFMVLLKIMEDMLYHQKWYHQRPREDVDEQGEKGDREGHLLELSQQ